MEKYGQLLDSFETPQMEIYKIISSYFDNPIMTKVKSDKGLAFYAVRTTSLMLKDSRYLIALLPEDGVPLGQKTPLASLNWVSFQTRTLSEDWKVPIHRYSDKEEGPWDIPISLHHKDANYNYYYRCRLPIEIELITPRTSFPNYPQTGTIAKALETFQTVIAFLS